MFRRSKFDPIAADIRDRLHRLPVRSGIYFKLGLLVYKWQHGNAPSYFVEILPIKSEVPALRRLRSTARGDLMVPRTLTRSIGPRSFSVTGAAFWNTSPDEGPITVNRHF